MTVAKKDGTILFADAKGKKLFQDYDRSLTPVEVNGEKTYHSEMFSNLWDSTEGFFGLGQHQAGVWNYHGETVDISEANTNISVPIVLSSNGYGIYWNNSSRSQFNNRFPHELYLSSEVADTVDYYFIYGPEFDNIIAAYRDMTGQAPMFGKWAYGFWQCKNKYGSQAEVLGVAHKYRELHIPVDNIVQDWFWWNIMGEPVFNKNYPDPKGMIDDLHQNHFHVMFSFWPYFRPGSPVYDEMDKRGYFIDKMKVSGFHPAGQALYDAFNPAAREYYWRLIDKGLFKIGADAWWLDTDEPETEGRETNILVTNKVALGSGARYANLYPLMTTTAVYEGQRDGVGSKTRVHFVAFGVCGSAAKFDFSVVGRRRVELAEFRSPDSGRIELLFVGDSLLDDGHRRIHHREPGRSRRIANCSCDGLNTARSVRFSGFTERERRIRTSFGLTAPTRKRF